MDAPEIRNYNIADAGLKCKQVQNLARYEETLESVEYHDYCDNFMSFYICKTYQIVLLYLTVIIVQ